MSIFVVAHNFNKFGLIHLRGGGGAAKNKRLPKRLKFLIYLAAELEPDRIVVEPELDMIALEVPEVERRSSLKTKD
jgi:hypothetical protein